jgi:hypothetical protein
MQIGAMMALRVPCTVELLATSDSEEDDRRDHSMPQSNQFTEFTWCRSQEVNVEIPRPLMPDLLLCRRTTMGRFGNFGLDGW